MIDWLLDLKDNIDKHGIRFGMLLTLYAIYRKERRNFLLDRRDELHRAYFEALLDKLGGPTCADISKRIKEPLAPRGVGGFIFSLEERCSVLFAKLFTNSNSRRKKKMNTSNLNYVTLIPALVGVLKLLLQSFGIDLSHVTDSQINDAINGIAAIIAIIGVFLPHKKGVSTNDATQSSNVSIGNK